MQMWKQNRRHVVVICAVLCLTLGGCSKKEEPPEPPAAYEVGGDSAPSMNETLGETSGTLTAVEAPQTDAPEDGDTTPALAPTYTYTYSEQAASGQAVADYVTALTGEAEGFQVVDGEDQVVDPPAFDTETGSVSLAKSSGLEGKVLRLDIDWSDGGCTVEVSQQEGAVQADLPEETPRALTALEAVGFLEDLSPATLGLEGSSMKAYKVYYLDGEVLVDGRPCACLRVYSTGAAGDNVFEGTYMITGDRQHLYRMTNQNTAVEEMSLNQTTQANLKKG